EDQKFIEARIAQCIRELSVLPSTTGEPEPKADEAQGDDKDGAVVHPSAAAHGKLHALIDLKGLQLHARQQALRRSVVTHLHEAAVMTIDRSMCCRFCRSALCNVRHTKAPECQQRKECERHAKQKHLDYLGAIVVHGKEIIATNQNACMRLGKPGRTVLQFHVATEKEEQKHIEHISKEHLKALKADNEGKSIYHHVGH
ncbi:hypothetical protein FRC11_009498, partial [Ceratobasidium sp. 423]